MVKCSFSGKELPKGQGIMYVKKDGTILYFYSSKERKNFLNLGREGRLQKWTPAARAFKAENEQRGKRSAATKKIPTAHHASAVVPAHKEEAKK